MRFGLSSGAFWGVFFILVGLFAILKSYLNINMPTFRFAVAVLLILAGIAFLTGGGRWWTGDATTVAFERRVVSVDRNADYTAIFGEGEFHLPEGVESNLNIKVNGIFGSAVVWVPRDLPIGVHASTAFGSVETPDGSSAAFGERTYESPNYEPGKPHVFVEAAGVFGSVRIRTR